MFPFKVSFSRTLNEHLNLDQVSHLLDISEDKLREAGADHISKENNLLKFDNNLFKLTWNWNLLVPIDAGFVEIKMDKNDNLKIRYGITIINLWIIVIIFAIIFWISDKDINAPLIILGGLGGLNWLIAILRHQGFFNEIIDMIIEYIKKSKE